MLEQQEKDWEVNREQQACWWQMHKANCKQQQKQQEENRKLLAMVTQLSQTQVTQSPSQGNGRPHP